MTTILELLREHGLTPKRVASTNGGEYASPCPGCGGEDRFRVWPEQGEGGRWWCRQCGSSGDTIQFLRDFQGLNYKEACERVGRELGPRPVRSVESLKGPRQSTPGRWTPRKPATPPDKWRQKAALMVDWTIKQLWGADGAEVLGYLKSRGLIEETIRDARLGWNPKKVMRRRLDWGLPIIKEEAGFPRKKLSLPAGITIPYFVDGRVVRVRIRSMERNPDRRYHCLASSSSATQVLGEGPVFVVVEAELDALLLHQEAGCNVGVIGLGSAQIRPDEYAAELLGQADLILVALDSDMAGAKEAHRWWPAHFEKARRWPIPSVHGKDPGEAHQAGFNLGLWIAAALKRHEEMLNGRVLQGIL